MTDTTTALAEAQIFEVTDLKDKEAARLQALADKSKKALEIEITDRLTLKEVHDARIALRDNRTKLAKDRKGFTAHLDEKKNSAISIEKELLGIISPIEEALLAKEEAYEKEQERIKAQQKKEEEENLQRRIERLNSVEAEYVVGQIASMSNEGFEFLFESKEKAFKLVLEERQKKADEDKRLADEAEKKRQDEAEAVRKQKEENDRIAAENKKKADELAEKAKEIDEKQKTIDSAESKKKREEELETARKEGETKAKEDLDKQAEADKKEKELAEKANEEMLQKHKEYMEWLKSCEVTEDEKVSRANINEVTDKLIAIRPGGLGRDYTLTIYKKVSTFVVEKAPEVTLEVDPANQEGDITVEVQGQNEDK